MNDRHCNSHYRQSLNLDTRKQKGATAVIVAVSIVVLIGSIGLALDLGKLFITKSELQNSADACALAAARELSGSYVNQLSLAEAAGIEVGIRNDVFFQQDPVSVGSSNITFSETLDGTYLPKDSVANILAVKFARCTVERTDIANWFMQVLGIGNQQVSATAVASLVPGQTTCAFPVAMCEDKLIGKVPGDWLETLLEQGTGAEDNLEGDFLWASFNSKPSNKALTDQIIGSGECNIPSVGEEIGTPGSKKSAFAAWNTRFGVYKGGYDKGNAPMDYSGYAYTAKNWSTTATPPAPFTCEKAYIGSNDFIARRTAHEPMQTPSDIITGLKLPGYKFSESIDHASGMDRRIVQVPVVDCSELQGKSHQAAIKSWACVLLLHPLDTSGNKNQTACFGKTDNRAYLEYLGKADDPASPCASSGMAGGPASTGPLVPALVQ